MKALGPLVMVVVVWFIVSGAKKERAVERASTQESVAAAQAKRERDEAASQRMGVSYEAYVRADEQRTDAYLDCKRVAKNAAVYGATSDWMPNYRELVTGDVIKVVGEDLKFKNAFNAERYVPYVCTFDMNTRETRLLNVDWLPNPAISVRSDVVSPKEARASPPRHQTGQVAALTPGP